MHQLCVVSDPLRNGLDGLVGVDQAPARLAEALVDQIVDRGELVFLFKYTADMAGTGFSGFQKVQEFNLGVTVPYGAASFVAEYGYNRYNVAANNEKATGNDFMVGANYAFSKRTDVYVRAAQLNDLKNGDDKNWTRVYAAGIRHKF